MFLILLGPPGAGKGTQAVALVRATGLIHLATGEMFRENVRSGTELGVLAQRYMDRGALVPDEITTRMLLERIARPDAAAGALLDGFPRTIEQAEALDAALAERSQQVDAVLLLDIDETEIQTRLSGRWSCPQCEAVYHEHNSPPKTAGYCDACGAALTQRDDDKQEAIAHRLRVYREQTAPLIAYYERAGTLRRVDGAPVPEQVWDALQHVVEKVG